MSEQLMSDAMEQLNHAIEQVRSIVSAYEHDRDVVIPGERLLGELQNKRCRMEQAVHVTEGARILSAAMIHWRDNNKIAAIKFLRASCQLGLKEAKDILELFPPPQASIHPPAHLFGGEFPESSY